MSKVAVASLSAVIETSHSLEPLTVPGQFEPQLTGLELAPGAPTSLTRVPWLKLASQVPLEQLIPGGVLVTVPVPVPLIVTFSLRWTRSKVAVTCLASVIVTLHSFEPVTVSQPEVQTTGLLFGPGVPARVTS